MQVGCIRTRKGKAMASIIYQTESCTRCGGCGRYSWCEMHGDRCFKCNGTGLQLTRAGAKARDAVLARIAALTTVPMAQVKVGDVMREHGKRHTVVKTGLDGGSITSDGVCKPTISLHFKAGWSLSAVAEHQVTLQPTPDQWVEIMALADTLPGCTVVR